jgi:DNA-directed RNA polymerase subunit M/transcription elongation factor TFIIS
LSRAKNLYKCEKCNDFKEVIFVESEYEENPMALWVVCTECKTKWRPEFK